MKKEEAIKGLRKVSEQVKAASEMLALVRSYTRPDWNEEMGKTEAEELLDRAAAEIDGEIAVMQLRAERVGLDSEAST